MSTHLSQLRISPNDWPSKEYGAKPGDFSKFISKYGSEPCITFAPILDAPEYDGYWGMIYFKDWIRKEAFLSFLEMMGVYERETMFAAYVQEASNPIEDGYYKQIRLISNFALKYRFDTLHGDEYNQFPPQTLTLGEVLWGFIEDERARVQSGELSIYGSMGGDGDDAYEALSFGFMLEDACHGVYRIWSRAWLVAK